MIPFRIPNRVSLTDLSPITKKKKTGTTALPRGNHLCLSICLSVCLSDAPWEGNRKLGKKKKKKGRKGKRKKGREEKRKIKGPVLCNSHQVTE